MKNPKSAPPCTTPFPGVDGDGNGVAPTISSGPGLNLSDQDAGDGTDVGEPEAATNGTIANDVTSTSDISITNRRRVFHTG